MPKITTALARPEIWKDIQHTLSGGGDGRSCQCVWPVLTNKEWETTDLDQRTAMFQQEVASSRPPGLVAYVDGDAAGWIRVGPRTLQRRLGRTRNIVATTREPLDDDDVWAVSCFVVRREYRGLGLNAKLLDAAVTFARESGARAIEGYPIDTARTNVRVNDLFHGALSTFLSAGFEKIDGPKPERPLVSLTIA
ncbi:ribosomal protein S18 acetylase RimI-like enzyme [Microbacterium ginsengiterrae]|uniref:Ribosomal protein S18 acetylase RimI-like enzyme n=1 Tax=Microbacterium ginsengiterrae TaxID=546115 RepID=A0A7W9CA82_9MICO|nr:GNAT family N-acetyltransferase [Microbacterium ginsengiterrae]MBB5741681.1 ribosomal protein S18 acetylase RimI-like enzyme [Microbacterium ginsengiterrae]